MKKYESAIIIIPEIKGKKLKEFIKKVNIKLKEEVKITDVREEGLRKLAYTVKGKNEGYYVFHEFEIADEKNCETIARKIEKYFRTQEEIIKFIVVERG